MTKIFRDDRHIVCEGHASVMREDDPSSTELCAMITALSTSLCENIEERLKEDVDYCLKKGLFYIHIDNLSRDAMVLVDSFWYSMNELMQAHPDDIKLVKQFGEDPDEDKPNEI